MFAIIENFFNLCYYIYMNILNDGMNLTYIVDSKNTINNILTSQFNMSKRLKTKLINNKNVLLNGSFVDTRNTVDPGDKITLVLNYPEDSQNIIDTEMDLEILYEDDFLLAVNKPAGVAVHPSILHYNDSLSNGIKYYYKAIGLKKKIRIINRIDLNTSGIVLFAKNEYIQECLIKQMESKKFAKTYLALVDGHISPAIGTINKPIARKENSIIERCISKNGQKSITHYKVLKNFNNYTLIECSLGTGRTHQIRVHMASINHPVLGDTLYGTSKPNVINRQALHSYKIKFIHPISKNTISIKAPIPKDMQNLINI